MLAVHAMSAGVHGQFEAAVHAVENASLDSYMGINVLWHEIVPWPSIRGHDTSLWTTEARSKSATAKAPGCFCLSNTIHTNKQSQQRHVAI